MRSVLMSKSTALNNPKTIGFGIGAIVKPSKFYSAKSVVINSIWGEAIIAASDDLVMSSISRLVMPEDFNLDLSMAQDIAIFGRKAVIVGGDNSHDKLTEENKMLREALELADSWLKTDAEYWGSPVCVAIIKAIGACE
jgi:hypothetical protein